MSVMQPCKEKDTMHANDVNICWNGVAEGNGRLGGGGGGGG